MQGTIFMPENPQQGSPPPNNTLDPDHPSMEVSTEPNQPTNDIHSNEINQSDSGIYSTTNHSNMDAENGDSDSRSECSTPERKFVCPICETSLTSQHDFTLHIRSHNNVCDVQDVKGFTCRICSKVLSSSSSLDRHVLVHSGERPFHCRYCGDSFTTNGNMHRHMRTHINKPEYESDGSDSNVSSASSKSTEFNNNQVEQKKRKRQTTDECNKKVKNLSEQDETTQFFKCPVCNRTDFDSIIALETHLEDNHQDYPAKCNECNQIFQNNKVLTIHRATVHNQAKKTVSGFRDLTFVDFSSNKFPHIARYECEKNIHTASDGLTFQCKFCHRAFPCTNSLEIHEKDCASHARPLGIDLSTSKNLSDTEIRRSEFFNILNLQDNSPEKVPPMDYHGSKLQQQLLSKLTPSDSSKDLADIQTIISMTTNGSLLQQLQAKSDLSSRKSLELSHDYQARPEEEEAQDVFAIEFRKMKLRGEFPCRLCTAVFPNLRALKGHNRTHLNSGSNGLYRCNMCNHSSIDKAAVIRHMRTHNGDRPYECALCNYAFTTKANCERHLRNRHSKTTREDVKKAIIYHPSEDPTNEELNKLAVKEEKKFEITEKLPHTPRQEMTAPPLISTLLKETLSYHKEPLQLYPNMSTIRNENLKSLKDHSLHKESFIPNHYNFTPKLANASTPQMTSKIQVKNLHDLKETSKDYSDDEEFDEEEPIDLSKKNVIEESSSREEEEVTAEDLSTKATPPLNVHEIFAQQIFKNSSNLDQAAWYASQLAMYRSAFPSFPSWPLLFPSLHQTSLVSPDAQDMKERLQRIQLCGGSMISDNYNEHFKGLNFKPEMKPESPFENIKPPTINIDAGYSDGSLSQPKAEHSPNSVKMVIKNGVLMPKQKQRRYRTERPFTCEHCSARFTLRSNMERHIKQQHPHYWSQRQKGQNGPNTPGRKSQNLKNYCDLSIPNYDIMKTQDYDDTKDMSDEKLKLALMNQQMKPNLSDIKKEDDDDFPLIIDENSEKEVKTEEACKGETVVRTRILEEKLKELHAKHIKTKNEENQDLVSVSRLLDDASQQQFKEYFKRGNDEPEIAGGSEEDEEGLIASGSTSESNISGAEEHKVECEVPAPVKKKSAYSLAPNRVSCPFCERKFPWSSSLRRHVLTHTGQKPFNCTQCPLLFTTKSNCDRHLLRKHGKNAATITNEAANNNATNYLMRNVPERPFKCSNCPSSTFSTYSNLKKHISCKHSNNAQNEDGKGYDAGSSEDEKQIPNGDPKREPLENLSKVENTIQNCDLPFKCHLCEGSFGERQDALDHIKRKHFTEYDLLMSKNALDLNATTPDEAMTHDDDDELRGKFPDYSNRKVICAFCMRRFWSAEDLRRHMRTHTGERPFSCDICRRRFTLKHSMLRHRKKHNFSFENEVINSDEDGSPTYLKPDPVQREKTDESDGNEGSDLISNLLGIGDRSFIDKVLTASADDAAKLLGVKNGVRE